MSCGVPVLSNLNCGSEELIADGLGWHSSEINSPDALAKYLAWILGLMVLIILGAMLVKRYKNSFGVMANAYLNAYRAL